MIERLRALVGLSGAVDAGRSGPADRTGDDEATHTGDAATHTGDAATRIDDATRVALFVDGPNVLRDEFDVDLDDVRDAVDATGQRCVTRLYVDEHATPGLIQAAEARGYEVVVTSGDVDVRLAIDATECALSGAVDVLAVASRDTDFKPVLEKAGTVGVRTMAIAPGTHGRSDALRNAANDAILLGE